MQSCGFSKIVFLVIILLGLSSAGLVKLNSTSIQPILQCATSDEYHSLVNKACEFYLHYLRDKTVDISELATQQGLNGILSLESPRKYCIATLFVSNGLNVNTIDFTNHNAYTPLHNAILRNDPNEVRFLLELGADATLRSGWEGLTPLEFAQLLNQTTPSKDRTEVLNLLYWESGL